MENVNVKLSVIECTMQRDKVEIYGLSCNYVKDNALCVKGIVKAKQHYRDWFQHNLVIKGNFLNKDGEVLYVGKDLERRSLETTGEDIFQIYLCGNFENVNITDVVEVEVYTTYEFYMEYPYTHFHEM